MRWVARLALVTLLAAGCAASPDPGVDTPGSVGGSTDTATVDIDDNVDG